MARERSPRERQSDPAEAFELLAAQSRVDVVRAFAEDYPTPVRYSTIQRRTGIDDNELLNYHLNGLKGHFITEVEGGYELPPAGW